MKLSEIVKIPSNQNAILKTKPEVENLIKIGKIENREVFSGNVKGEARLKYIEHQDVHGSTTAFLIYQEIKLKETLYALVNRVWVSPKFQRQGYMSGLFLFIKKIIEIPLMSDEEQTPEARELWKSLAKKGEVKILNIVNNTIHDIDEIGLDKVYSNSAEPTNFRLILEKFDWNHPNRLRTKLDEEYTQNNYYTDGDL